ncbi:MAG: glycine cleavage system protein R [Alphaproteobacteria bacterium]|nr:glycine cleavage system protein R [Alphaproteobacteria bacterium]
MSKALIVTFIADDRPGLVEKLSAAVAGAGGNWLESRMVHMAEKFAGIARVEMPQGKEGAGDVAGLRRALSALEKEGFQLTVGEATGSAQAATGRMMILDLVGPDRPGIVREIARCLAERGISVEDMETDIRPAPMSGDDLFYAKARVRLPPGADVRALSNTLHALGNTLVVDVALMPES